MKTSGGFLITQIKQLQARVGERLLAAHGISLFNGAQGKILYVLWENGTMPISQIGKLTSLAKTTLTGMLDRMEAGGMIRRVPDTSNRRQILIALTEEALAYRMAYDAFSEEMNEVFYKGFTEAEITALEAQLTRIVANLEEEERANG